MNIAAFVSGPIIDFFYILFGGGVTFAGSHFTPNRLVSFDLFMTLIEERARLIRHPELMKISSIPHLCHCR